MNEKAKRDMPDFVPPLFGAIWAMHAHNCAVLAEMAVGIRRKIILPKIICFRKVAL
jgi:hypothetical protein